VGEPIVLLDEPTSSSDLRSSTALLADLNQQLLFLSTHDLNSVALGYLLQATAITRANLDVFTPAILEQTFGAEMVV